MKKFFTILLFLVPTLGFSSTININDTINTSISDTVFYEDEEPDPEDDPIRNKPYLVVDNMPKFPGGKAGLLNYMTKYVKYPYSAIERKLQGKVYIECIIEFDGSISNIRIKKGVDPILDRAAYYLVRNMPNWVPGQNDKVPVRVQIIIPVDFVYSDKPLTPEEIKAAKNFENEIKNYKVIRANYKVNPALGKDDFIISFYSDNVLKSLIKERKSKTNKKIQPKSKAKYKKPTTDYKVEIGESDELSAILFSQKTKKVIKGLADSTGVLFTNMRIGEKITIIACKRKGTRILFAIKETAVQDTVIPELFFKHYTFGQFEAETKKLRQVVE